jgi:CheY-like chemotaxis protein
MELVNDLLDYSKIEAGKLELAPQDVDVALLTRQLVELLAARAHAKNIELVCEIAPDLPKLIWIDGNRLRQVLVNLIGNAIKFTQTGGVTVRLSSTAGKPDHINLGFEIEDSGIGIEQSAHERVFGEFEQIDGSSTRQFGGTGLGLAISRRIIRKMGGDISIASRPGEGTTFSSSLSVAVTDPTPNRFITAQPAQRLLILSPHPRQTAVIAAELKHVESDCQAFAAVNPAVATFSAAAGGDRPYTLVLLDHACDPVGTMQAMRENVSANKPSPRFAVMLPPESRENLQQLAADGFDAYVIRPLRVETLHALLAGDLVELENMLPSIRSERTALPQIGSGRHVLVAEDNEINAILLNAFLTKIGYQVHIATDGVEAVKAYENSVRASSPAFDLVICDLRMPRLDGAGTVAAIRKIESQNGLPRMSVCALSADVATEVSEQALAAGFDGVFSKPLDPAAFTQMLSHRNARAA